MKCSALGEFSKLEDTRVETANEGRVSSQKFVVKQVDGVNQLFQITHRETKVSRKVMDCLRVSPIELMIHKGSTIA